MVQSMIVLFLAFSAVQGHHDEEYLAPSDPTGEHYNGNVGVVNLVSDVKDGAENGRLVFSGFVEKWTEKINQDVSSNQMDREHLSTVTSRLVLPMLRIF